MCARACVYRYVRFEMDDGAVCEFGERRSGNSNFFDVDGRFISRLALQTDAYSAAVIDDAGGMALRPREDMRFISGFSPVVWKKVCALTR